MDQVLRGVVAIDGPSGTGKSTVARRLAVTLGAAYLDTGAMYRAVALAALRAGADLADPEAIAAVLPGLVLEIGSDPASAAVRLHGEDVRDEIRGPAVTLAVSPVAATPEVREHLVRRQRAAIRDAVRAAADHADAGRGGIVVEGRDIGTVVAPDAGLKVYLTADAAVRARRRTDQDGAAGRVASVDATLADVRRRDEYDAGRAVSPMRPAADAVEVDTSALDIDGVVAHLVALVVERGMAAPAIRT